MVKLNGNAGHLRASIATLAAVFADVVVEDWVFAIDQSSGQIQASIR